ncbi:hypothetical protein B2G69_07560 [Methylorubrum zatmanii]|nr:hypothetical protein B2G69_07560 [Methylorubrum zatmanii]
MGAVRLGYRHFDTATVYNNEAEFSEGLRSLDVGWIGQARQLVRLPDSSPAPADRCGRVPRLRDEERRHGPALAGTDRKS